MNNEIINKTSFNITGNFGIVQKGEEKRIIAGYASVIEVDDENDYIPKEALKNGIETLLKNSDYSNLMLIHKNIQIGKVMKSYNKLKTHVDDIGLFIVAEIRKDLDIANQVWNDIVKGVLNGFSIAAEVLKSREICNSTKCIKLIERMNIFEISVCNQPTNSKSGFVVISKSKTNPVNVDDVIKAKENNMTDVENKSNDVENDSTISSDGESTETLSENIESSDTVDEFDMRTAFDELSRQIEALTGIVSELQKPDEEPEEPSGPEPVEKSIDDEHEEEITDDEVIDDEEEDDEEESDDEENMSIEEPELVNLPQYTEFLTQYFSENKNASPKEAYEVWKTKNSEERDVFDVIDKSMKTIH